MNTHLSESANPLVAHTAERPQFLTFTLQEEEYGVDILRVQEIKGFSRITPIPNTPPCVRGVMNLRGTIVPIVDLRLTFGMPRVEYTQFTVIIVVMVGRKVAGLVVDAVSDVLDLSKEQIEPPPELGAAIDTSFLTGLAKVDNRLITLLDMEQLLGRQVLGSETSAA
jgi:purine-binding chemotaxis protein CheW